MVHVVCFHSFIKDHHNTAVQELSAATAGVQPRVIMTLRNSGDSVRPAFYVMEVTRMVTAAIFRSFMAVKCTRPAPLRMKPNPGVPPLTTMTWTNSGVTVEVNIAHIKDILNVAWLAQLIGHQSAEQEVANKDSWWTRTRVFK